jgi:hypothetical protein
MDKYLSSGVPVGMVAGLFTFLILWGEIYATHPGALSLVFGWALSLPAAIAVGVVTAILWPLVVVSALIGMVILIL